MTREGGRPPEQAVDQALALARSGEVVEAALEDSASVTVTVADGEPESTEDRRERGLGIRVFSDGRVGFAATSDLSPAGVGAAVDLARGLAAHGRREEANRPAAGSAAPEEPGAPDAAEPAALVEPACLLEAAARAEGRGLLTRAASVTAAAGRWLLAHSGGLRVAWAWRRGWASLEVVAERDDLRQTGWESDWAPEWPGIDVERIGRLAARRALGKFGARRPTTARTAVVLAPTVTSGLLEALGDALSGKAVVRERSLFAGKVGRTVASPAVTLTDDGARPDGFSSAPWDGEGTPSGEAGLIRQGVLSGYLHDIYTAARLHAEPTGHALRDEFGARPHVGSRNLCLQPSGPSAADIVAGVDRGILVEEVMGLHTVDPVSGDFSLGATGRELRSGQPGEPLEGFTIAGNIGDILGAVQAVGDDLRFLPGGAGGCTVLLEGLSVSGG